MGHAGQVLNSIFGRNGLYRFLPFLRDSRTMTEGAHLRVTRDFLQYGIRLYARAKPSLPPPGRNLRRGFRALLHLDQVLRLTIYS